MGWGLRTKEYRGLLKIQFIGGLTEKLIRREVCIKLGGRGGGSWTVCRFKRGFGKKEGGCVYECDGVDTSIHSMKSVVDHSWQNHNSAPLRGNC